MSDQVDAAMAEGLAAMVELANTIHGQPMMAVLILVPEVGGTPFVLSNTPEMASILEFCAEHHANARAGQIVTESGSVN